MEFRTQKAVMEGGKNFDKRPIVGLMLFGRNEIQKLMLFVVQ